MQFRDPQQDSKVVVIRAGTGTLSDSCLRNTSGRFLFDVVGRGIVKVEINQTYPLRDAAQAHRDLESRKTTGSTVLIP